MERSSGVIETGGEYTPVGCTMGEVMVVPAWCSTSQPSQKLCRLKVMRYGCEEACQRQTLPAEPGSLAVLRSKPLEMFIFASQAKRGSTRLTRAVA
ncbi:hypothetical protein SJI00_05170 [Pseudomonas sp. RP23018S]|uniref:hypothetical protein n=1 Tax=Pseudomonas sp. RP23018S TaxID=3096037 RepID=UPI002ACAACB1|nr:hypothetical protein [Pseudomonas sp. RP23018S]MDZ5602167.1 hypothetical protein [Pseudomonas sp. RP23018S]